MESTFNINFEHEVGYLRAEVFGEADNYHVTMAYWKRIGEELSKTQYKNLLVVEMLKEAIEIRDAVQAIRDRDPRDFAGVKIAFFDIKKDHGETNSSGAVEAFQLGYEIKVFSDIHQAKDWLLQG